MKNTCLSPGDSVEKLIPRAEKSNGVGAGARSGSWSPRNTPVSALIGTNLAPEIPFISGIWARMVAIPSGGLVGVVFGMNETLPVTENVNVWPASEPSPDTCTGGVGVKSSQQIVPAGMPASRGLASPDTIAVTLVAWIGTQATRIAANPHLLITPPPKVSPQ
jgi:hypothetical protein